MLDLLTSSELQCTLTTGDGTVISVPCYALSVQQEIESIDLSNNYTAAGFPTSRIELQAFGQMSWFEATKPSPRLNEATIEELLTAVNQRLRERQQ